MRILYLGPPHVALESFLCGFGDTIRQTERQVSGPYVTKCCFDWIISYRYRHILRRDVLDAVEGRALNLHISLLPWNRGAHPNVWSWVCDTPKGVTIHLIDAGIDTGDILAQRRLNLPVEGQTLATTYGTLCRAIEGLFMEHWPEWRLGRVTKTPQPPGGSAHRAAHLENIRHLLTDGWNTPVARLEEFAGDCQMAAECWRK